MSADARALAVTAALAAPPARARLEVALVLAALLALVFLPAHYALINEIAILALFAVSLDLVLGYTGIVSLGHAAFFGTGAYAAGLFAVHVSHDPLLGLAVGVAAGALAGLASSVLVMRGTELTRLMMTLGVQLIVLELANRFDGLTGGADGLQGVTMSPLLGRFEFDLAGRTACFYSVAVLLVVLAAARRLVRSPFGVSLRAIRENALRATAIGIGVRARIAAVYTLAAALAGAAGALLAQTSGFVSLDALDFHRSADVLLVLVLGGSGWLYGGVVGAIAFTLVQDWLAALTPQYWTFWIGLVLVALPLVGRERLLAPWRTLAGRR